MSISSSIILKWLLDWPKVSIFWWVHWDEPSWTLAIKKFLKDVKQWKISILKGEITCVSEANEEALKVSKREIKVNLNRVILDENISEDCYENKRAQELKNILRDSDFLLDLHSTSGPSIPFMFSEKQNFDLASKMWISHIIMGWSELGEDLISGDTESYINMHWWKWYTFEAWNHNNPQWKEVAYQMLLNFLSTIWCIDASYFSKIWEEKLYVNIKEVYIAQSNDFTYCFDTYNFQKIMKGTCIAIDNGEKIEASYDMILIMPKNQDIVEKWNEVFFIWEQIIK